MAVRLLGILPLQALEWHGTRKGREIRSARSARSRVRWLYSTLVAAAAGSGSHLCAAAVTCEDNHHDSPHPAPGNDGLCKCLWHHCLERLKSQAPQTSSLRSGAGSVTLCSCKQS